MAVHSITLSSRVARTDVGAGVRRSDLLAKAPSHSTLKVSDQPLSRASARHYWASIYQ